MKSKYIKYFITIITLVVFASTILVLNASGETISSGYQKLISELDPSTNFFTQTEDTRTITINDETDEVLEQGYVKVTENDDLVLYRLDRTLGIAIYDKHNGYMWYSTYKNYQSLGLTDALIGKIESGVTIEYYDANSASISSNELSLTGKTSKKPNTVSYANVKNGFKATVNFVDFGISFDVYVQLDGMKLNVNVPCESIKEVPVKSIKSEKKYQLKSITLFPYLGSQNYEINGYSFIPDGSGALIRYSNVGSSTGFIKTVYGEDYGIKPLSTLNAHIKNNQTVTLPIYGVNHGYNQAAYLCEIVSGDGASELHSYPYMYRNLPINTTFFKFATREIFTVQLSSTDSMTLINELPYQNDYTLSYSFLNGDKANYVGMANAYRESLNLEKSTLSNTKTPLHLTVLGLDYKEGLFGKNYITMTTFEDAYNIVQDLEESDVSNFQLTYLGWNKGGYFNDGATNAKLASQLGKKDYGTLIEYLGEKNYNIDYTVNPLISDTYGYGSSTIKKINMSAFEKTLVSSLVQEQYVVNPSKLSERILKRTNRYEKLNISSLNIDGLNSSYSYRDNSSSIYRDQMVDIIGEQVSILKLNNFQISTSTPNAYVLKYLENSYETPYESSKYMYETDSVPFIQILLSGYVNMFAPNMNYISDVELMNLRMIEYNLYPSFLITEEEAYDLRFTNYEYLNSTQYDLWKSLIVSSYDGVSNALDHVRGESITSHRYIESGVCEVKYSNNVTIYINYNNTTYDNGSLSIEPYQYKVVRG